MIEKVGITEVKKFAYRRNKFAVIQRFEEVYVIFPFIKFTPAILRKSRDVKAAVAEKVDILIENRTVIKFRIALFYILQQ